MRFVFFLLVWLSYVPLLHGQVSGIVYDAENQQPLEGVMISREGEILDISNVQGRFVLEEVDAGDTLYAERIGYTRQSFVLTGKTEVSIGLRSKSFSIEDVTIRAYNTRQQAFQSPGALEVLNAEQIRRISVAAPDAVLNSMPGLYMHSGAKNTNRITIRGIGSRSMYTTTKVKAYLNEIPLTSGIGETTLEDLDLDLVDRITVLKGPSSSIYGGALGGTILYHMGDPVRKGLSVRQKTTLGSYNELQNTSQVKWKGDQAGVRVAYNKFQSNGFRENDHYNRDALTSFVNYQVSDKVRISYLGRFHTLKAYIPSSIDRETYLNDPHSAADNWSQVDGHETYEKWLNGVSSQVTLTDQLQLTTSLFAKLYDGKEIRPFNILDDQSTSTGIRTILRHKKQSQTFSIHTRVGSESLYEMYQWNIFETLSGGDQGLQLGKNEQKRTHHNVFAEAGFEWKKWALDVGMNANKTAYRYHDLYSDSVNYSDQKSFDWIFSPRISLTWQPSQQIILFGNLSHGFSTPSYEETLNAEGYVTGSVQPETGWNRELGIRLKDADHRWYFKGSAYSVAVDNLLVTKRIAEDEFYKINAGETHHRGVDFLGRIQWLQTAYLKSSLHLSYMLADYRFQEFVDEGSDYSGNHLPGIPKHKGYIQLDLDLDMGFYMVAGMVLADVMPMNDANDLFTDPYQKADLKVGYRRSFSGQWVVDFFSGIRNLSDQHYPSMVLINAPSFGGSAPRYFYPAAPRHYFGGFSLRWYFK